MDNIFRDVYRFGYVFGGRGGYLNSLIINRRVMKWSVCSYENIVIIDILICVIIVMYFLNIMLFRIS